MQAAGGTIAADAEPSTRDGPSRTTAVTWPQGVAMLTSLLQKMCSAATTVVKAVSPGGGSPELRRLLAQRCDASPLIAVHLPLLATFLGDLCGHGFVVSLLSTSPVLADVIAAYKALVTLSPVESPSFGPTAWFSSYDVTTMTPLLHCTHTLLAMAARVAGHLIDVDPTSRGDVVAPVEVAVGRGRSAGPGVAAAAAAAPAGHWSVTSLLPLGITELAYFNNQLAADPSSERSGAAEWLRLPLLAGGLADRRIVDGVCAVAGLGFRSRSESNSNSSSSSSTSPVGRGDVDGVSSGTDNAGSEAQFLLSSPLRKRSISSGTFAWNSVQPSRRVPSERGRMAASLLRGLAGPTGATTMVKELFFASSDRAAVAGSTSKRLRRRESFMVYDPYVSAWALL